MPNIIVERTFEAPLTEADWREVEARMKPCLSIYGVRWIRSFWSVDRQRMIRMIGQPWIVRCLDFLTAAQESRGRQRIGRRPIDPQS